MWFYLSGFILDGGMTRVAPTGGLSGMSPPKSPNPACGFQWGAYRPARAITQGLFWIMHSGLASFGPRTYSLYTATGRID